MFREALMELEKGVSDKELTPSILASMGWIYAMAGRKVEAEKILEDLKDFNRQRYVSNFGIAIVSVALGKHEEALERLEQAFEEKEDPMTSLKVNPRLDPLRSNPRFEKLLQRMDFP
jgi:hypothetical protein